MEPEIIAIQIREDLVVRIHGIPWNMTKEEAKKIADVVAALGDSEAPVYRGDHDSTVCQKCGMIWKGTMGYSCPNTDCPMQYKAT